MKPDVVVKRSKIHGRGVFANRTFQAGGVVLKWDVSHRLTKRESQRLSKRLQTYLNRDADGRLILLAPPERFVNHSCQPNTKVRHARDVAIRRIRKDEEIIGDYSLEAGGPSSFVCNCKNKHCKKVIHV